MRRWWVGCCLAVLLVIGTVPGYADRDGHGSKGHGYRSHGHRSHGHRGHGHSGVRVFINPGFVVPFGSYSEPYAPPPVVVAPAPRVSVEPAPPPPTYWYYCDAAQAYYPYVQQCPGGWRQVLPSPPE
jgi:hypothetical protein